MMAESRIARIRPPQAHFSWWEAADGQRLRRMDWPQPAGTRARGNLLFAGGRADFIEKYLEAYADWHRSGWNVSAFDWRGQGLSVGEQAPENPESFDPLVEDLAGFMADWRAGGDGPFVVIGHSMGGHLLLRTLVDKAPALDAAVLIAPMVLVNSAPVPDWLAPNFAEMMCLVGMRSQPMWKTAKALSRPGSQRQGLLTGCRERYEDELFWWRKQPELRLGAPSWGWMRAAYRSSAAAFTAEKLKRVKLPVLLLATRLDRLVSAAAIERVAGLLPNAELEMFEDSAHEILREEDPIRSRALERIDVFLRANLQ
ncbi:MAG TPA: alpha/beta hydrolase [Allosphingosinicella sp.]|nr:alpha/beta hydrolase [Allosphingosinicella sp.]